MKNLPRTISDRLAGLISKVSIVPRFFLLCAKVDRRVDSPSRAMITSRNGKIWPQTLLPTSLSGATSSPLISIGWIGLLVAVPAGPHDRLCQAPESRTRR